MPRTYSSKGSPTDPNAYGMHVYAEFYVPSYGWVPADASIGRDRGKPDSYFGHTHDPFLINSKGFGIRLVPPVQGVKNIWIFQHYQWWFWGEVNDYDSYYTYRAETAPTATTSEATTSVAESSTSLVSPTLSSLTETAKTSTTETGPATTTLPIQTTWLQASWPYLIVAAAVVAITVSFLMRKGRRAS